MRFTRGGNVAFTVNHPMPRHAVFRVHRMEGPADNPSSAGSGDQRGDLAVAGDPTAGDFFRQLFDLLVESHGCHHRS